MITLNRASIAKFTSNITAAVLAPTLLFAIYGCSDAPAVAVDGPPPNPLLYEIANANGAVEGWLFGTIHALPPDSNWRTPAIAAAVNDADFLLVEIAALDNRGAMAATFTTLATTPGQPALEHRVPSHLVPVLIALLDRTGLDRDSFGSTESWAAALTLAQISAEGDPGNGADRALIREFSGRPVRELEGARAQLAIFDRLPETDQRDLLAAVVAEAESSKMQASILRAAWLTGDIAVLDAATRTGILADPELRETLLVQRNRDWVAAIVPMLKDEPRPLIAVGAAHLVGADGLASLLQAQGYRVRSIP